MEMDRVVLCERGTPPEQLRPVLGVGLRRRAKARLVKLDRAPREGASTTALSELLRERFVEPLTRKHMLRGDAQDPAAERG